MGIELHPSIVPHPGPWMQRAYLASYDISLTELAAHLGVSRQALCAVINGRAGLSARMALSFEKAFGIEADTLLRMQVAYDLAQLKLKGQEPDVKRMEVI